MEKLSRRPVQAPEAIRLPMTAKLPLLDNDQLRNSIEGVSYFKNTLKKYFLKKATIVYLYPLQLISATSSSHSFFSSE